MKIQGDHKTQTETEITNGLQDIPDELNLYDDLQKAETKTEEGTDQKKSNELGSREDLLKLVDETHKQDDEVVVTNDDELTFNNEIFGDVLRKMKAFIDKSKEEKFEKSGFILECEIFNEFFNLMEKHKKNLTDEDLLVVEKGFKLFIHAMDKVDPNRLFSTDLVYAKKEMFYMYFNLINLAVIQNYFKNAQMPAYLERMCRFSVSRILIVMGAASMSTDLGLNDVQRPINCIELLSLILNYVKTDLECSDLTSYPSVNNGSITRYFILSVIWNYSHKMILVRDMIEAGCLEIMINGLTKICKTPNVDYDLQLQIISIICNISRHDDGVKQLNNLNATEVIKTFQSIHENNILNTICCMVLAFLSTPEQIKKDNKRMNYALDTLLRLMYEASVSLRYRVFLFHLSEMLIVFVKLFNDDHTLAYIMEDSQVDLHTLSTVHFFINLLIIYHSKSSEEDPWKQLTCTALVNILWSVSFQDKYKQQLKNAGPIFKELIKNLTRKTDQKVSPNQYVPQYIENIQKAATGLLFNIDELTHSASEQVSSTSTVLDNNKKPMIMISYSHEDIEFCKQLYNEISRQGYDIWIDFKFLKTGDLWEQIAAGMKRANLIICLMSEDYCKSKSCRWEATYALDKLQEAKSVIPVFLRKHELPDWLEIRTAVLKYVRFHDLKQLENNKLFELIDMIEYSLSSILPKPDLSLHPLILPTHHEPVSIPVTKVNNKPILYSSNILPVRHDQPTQAKLTVKKLENQDISSKSSPVLCTTTDQSLYPEKPIEQWNKNDISQWFQHNEILIELRDLCRFKDGYELMAYARIFLDTEKFQYQMYSDEFLRRASITFGKTSLLLHEFTKFSNALRKLMMTNMSST